MGCPLPGAAAEQARLLARSLALTGQLASPAQASPRDPVSALLTQSALGHAAPHHGSDPDGQRIPEARVPVPLSRLAFQPSGVRRMQKKSATRGTGCLARRSASSLGSGRARPRGYALARGNVPRGTDARMPMRPHPVARCTARPPRATPDRAPMRLRPCVAVLPATTQHSSTKAEAASDCEPF